MNDIYYVCLINCMYLIRQLKLVYKMKTSPIIQTSATNATDENEYNDVVDDDVDYMYILENMLQSKIERYEPPLIKFNNGDSITYHTIGGSKSAFEHVKKG